MSVYELTAHTQETVEAENRRRRELSDDGKDSFHRQAINVLRWGWFAFECSQSVLFHSLVKSKSRKEQPRPLHPELVRELPSLKPYRKVTSEILVFPNGVPTMKLICADF